MSGHIFVYVCLLETNFVKKTQCKNAACMSLQLMTSVRYPVY